VADALSHPPDTNHGDGNNKNVTIFPPSCICTVKTIQGRTIVPNVKEVRRAIVGQVHNGPTAGHPGRDKTLRKVQQLFWWPRTKAWITEYIKGCATCQQAKILTHHKRTPSYHITTEEGTLPFQTIAMDLITVLPMKQGLDAILTIVDHGCSRAAIFLPCSTSITGPGIAQLYLNHVYPWYRLLKKIISDRDPRFTSHFGKALTK
jgi:hypothetical protein